ncbi:MAG: YncE family protein [Alphaproteobacteria bacterium]|nr:YncE family protein [Alphaproteobacteria bacterium]
MRDLRPNGFGPVVFAATLLAAALAARSAPAGSADIALSANDNHTTVVNGKPVGMNDPKPDNVSVIDLSGPTPRVLGTIDVAFSDIGPPTALTFAPDGSYALITSSTRPDAGAPDRAVPDDRISVLDLSAMPPRVLQVAQAGAGATTVRITPDGKLALVCDRMAGTVSVFTIGDKHLEPAGKVDLGNPKALPAGLGIFDHGRRALVSRAGDNMVSVLDIDGAHVTVEPRPITTGHAPDTMDVNAAGTLAVVTNIGRAQGDVDTVSLIDLTLNPPRTIDTVAVANAPEGVAFSPDGRFVAVNSINGTIWPQGSPFYHPNGILTVYAVEQPPPDAPTTAGRVLRRLTEAPVGHASQGVAFSHDGRRILVQNFFDHDISVLGWDGQSLTEQGRLAMPGGPAAIATPWP